MAYSLMPFISALDVNVSCGINNRLFKHGTR